MVFVVREMHISTNSICCHCHEESLFSELSYMIRFYSIACVLF